MASVRAAANGSASAATWTVTKPSGAVDDDYLVVVLYIDSNTQTITSVPSGWTLLDGPIDNPTTPDVRGWSYGKVASGEGASWDWTFSATAAGGWMSVAVQDADGTEVPTESNATGTASGTTHTTSSLTTGATACVLLFAAVDKSGSTSPGAYWSGWTNGLTERIDVETAVFIELGLADQTAVAAGTFTRAATSADSEGAVLFLVAVRDAVAGDPPQVILPDADTTTTGWTTTPLFSKVNDSSDATVITATLA